MPTHPRPDELPNAIRGIELALRVHRAETLVEVQVPVEDDVRARVIERLEERSY
jgi:hypothetical protein